MKNSDEVPVKKWAAIYLNEDFLNIFTQTHLKTVMVLHINHANEISPEVKQAVGYMQQAGIRLLNQSVLLAGINDSTLAQTALLKALFELDIQAYYLHQLDAVAGATHFAVDDETAREIHAEVSARLPGYLVPKLVKEVSGDKAKRPL